MSYQATVIKVMIASPSDVADERKLIREILEQWNYANSEGRKLLLMPTGWDTHSSPAMGERPQAIINQQVLSDCDLLVAVFWTRLGSPTGNAASGTVEEIEEHIKSGKPAMLYFSYRPVSPRDLDDEQHRALKAFRSECEKKGLIDSYTTTEEFKEKLARQLSQTVIRHFSDSDVSPTGRESGVFEENPRLSDDAKALLVAAASGDGHILLLRHMAGSNLQAGGKQLMKDGGQREYAKWSDAIIELVGKTLVEPRGQKNEVFAVTNSGYKLADKMGKLPSQFEHLRKAIESLVRAYDYGHRSNANKFEFWLKYTEVLGLGASEADLRYLADEKLIEYGEDITRVNVSGVAIREVYGFSNNTRLGLTDAGREWAVTEFGIQPPKSS
ncbi:MAG: DUF4062 domain-containing protein [Phycisphaerae bacterium]|nr:DUF4062 domain-containing protein [Phycisphaerae bacterium]